jgi:hypothetical protein
MLLPRFEYWKVPERQSLLDSRFAPSFPSICSRIPLLFTIWTCLLRYCWCLWWTSFADSCSLWFEFVRLWFGCDELVLFVNSWFLLSNLCCCGLDCDDFGTEITWFEFVMIRYWNCSIRICGDLVLELFDSNLWCWIFWKFLLFFGRKLSLLGFGIHEFLMKFIKFIWILMILICFWWRERKRKCLWWLCRKWLVPLTLTDEVAFYRLPLVMTGPIGWRHVDL